MSMFGVVIGVTSLASADTIRHAYMATVGMYWLRRHLNLAIGSSPDNGGLGRNEHMKRMLSVAPTYETHALAVCPLFSF